MKLYENVYSALKYFSFSSLHKMDWIFVLCFRKMKEQDMPFLMQLFPFSFTKKPKPVQENILVKAIGLWICFAWVYIRPLD